MLGPAGMLGAAAGAVVEEDEEIVHFIIFPTATKMGNDDILISWGNFETPGDPPTASPQVRNGSTVTLTPGTTSYDTNQEDACGWQVRSILAGHDNSPWIDCFVIPPAFCV